MNRPYSLNSARFLHTGRDNTDPRPQTAWERERMTAGFTDARPSLFDRHPWPCAMAVVAAVALICLAILGVMPR